jgi:hypothetical protein
METPGARSFEILTGTSLDDDNIDLRQSQFSRQHQPGRTASDDDHGMVGHRRTDAGHPHPPRHLLDRFSTRAPPIHSTTPGFLAPVT